MKKFKDQKTKTTKGKASKRTSRKKYTKKDFAWVFWTPENIKQHVAEIIAAKKTAYKVVKQIKNIERTFENTIVAIESSDHENLSKMHQIHLLKNVSPKESVRTAATYAEIALNNAFTDIEYDEGMYKAVKAFEARGEHLKGEDKKLFDDIMRGYKRMGFGLPKKTRQKVQRNSKLLTKYASSFEKNINDYKDEILVTKHELEGLPEHFIQGLLRSKGGKFRVTLDYPDIGPFLRLADNAQKRKELAHKNFKKGGKRNMTLLHKMITLRRENANLLHYKTHVDYRTETRMAKNAKTVERFLTRLITKVEKSVRKDIDALRRAKRKHLKKKYAKLEYYDIAYYGNRLRKELYDIDSEKIREYFPFEQVKKGTFEIYSKLFSVTFKQVKNITLWHKDAELYEVRDKGGSIRSYFILDLFPRAGKYGHACASGLSSGYRKKDGTYNTPMACMLANFNKPSKGKPSLMSHGEVETFFHEFGHVMHYVLTTAKYASQSGFNTVMDFVEAPSQMLENWVWERAPLQKLSRHYKTGKPLPKKDILALLRARHHMVLYGTMRQLILAYTDFTLHTKYTKDPNALYRRLVKKYAGIDIPGDNLFCAGWGHLCSYDAGYYSYMWALVYAADMFSRFKKEGVLNTRTGRDYKKMVLEKGGSADEYEMVRKFLGRKPNNRAFLKEIGL